MNTPGSSDPRKEVRRQTEMGFGAMAIMVAFCVGILLLFVLIPVAGLTIALGVIALIALAMLAYMWPILRRRRQPAEARAGTRDASPDLQTHKRESRSKEEVSK